MSNGIMILFLSFFPLFLIFPFLSTSFPSYSPFRLLPPIFHFVHPLADVYKHKHTYMQTFMYIHFLLCLYTLSKVAMKQNANINVSIYPSTFYLIVSIKARPFQNNMRKRNIHKDGINGEEGGGDKGEGTKGEKGKGGVEMMVEMMERRREGEK